MTGVSCVYTLQAVDPDVNLSDCRACHCLQVRRAARSITRLYEEKLRPHGLRATQFSVLAVLALRGPTPVGELADLLSLERTTLTRSVSLLERNGWTASGRSEDSRKHLVCLTPAGRRKLEEAFPAWREAQDQVGRLIDREGEGSSWGMGRVVAARLTDSGEIGREADRVDR